MSTSDMNAGLIESLNNASNLLNQFVPIFIYIFGIIGNLLNILVLTQRTLRSSPSAVFFLVSSIVGLIALLSGLTSRMMSGFATDLTLTVDWICKIRNFVLYDARTIFSWMILLATVDRWLSSSRDVHLRQMSSLKNVRRSMCIVLLFASLLNAPILYCYEANLTGALRGCYGSTYAGRLITDMIYAFGTTLIPLLLMIIFGFWTINNVHRLRSRVHDATASVLTVGNENTAASTIKQRKMKKRDQQLLKMLLVQVALLFLFTCPHAIDKVYSSFAGTPPAQSLQNAVNNFIFNLVTLINFIASGMPFYIYTLTGGSVFRNTLFDLVKTMGKKILCQ